MNSIYAQELVNIKISTSPLYLMEKNFSWFLLLIKEKLF